MQQLATIIQEQIDTLVDQYDARLRPMPGYSNLPEAVRRELERHVLNLIAQSLEAGDYSPLVHYAKERASQWDARGLNLAWFQQALIVPEELLVPLVQSVETGNFVWQALNRSQSVVWQMVAERNLQTEERFRSIVETAHSGIMIVDDQFHFIYANEQLTRISGYSQAELIGADFRQLLDEDSRRLVADRYVRRQRGEDVSADYEITFIRKDGQKRYVEMSAMLLRDASGRQQTVAQVLDVSERKQSEQALRDSQQLLQSVMDNIPQAVFWKDRQLRYLGCNQAFAEDTGLNLPQIIVGKTDYDMPWRTQAELYRADDQHIMDSGAAKINYEEQQTTPSGEITWLRTSKIPMHDADSNVIAVLGMYEDITEHKRVETALRENESRLRAIYEGSNDAIMLLNAQGFFDCNSYTLKLFGVASKEEFIRCHPADLSPAQQPDGQDSQTASQQHIQIAYQQGSDRFEWVHRRVTGEDFPAEVLLSAFEYGGAQVLQATVRDITERKQLEQRIHGSLELREHQVRVGTEIAQEIAAAPDLNEIFQRVVTLIKERFNYYHAQIFRYDSVLDAIVLVTGYGEIGQHMLADGHQLPMGRGVVGTAAASGRSILAADVTQDADWRPNPHLPETKGELAVPIKLREEVLGILDVQSDQAGALSADDRLLLEGLCGQIAVAMESTRLLDRTETLYRISSQLSAAQTYDEVLAALRQHTLLQEADLNISVNLYDRPWAGDDMPDWSTTLVRWSMLPTSAVSPRYPLKAFSAASTLLRPDEPTIVSDIQSDPRLDAASRELYGKRFGAGSTIFLPLVTAGKWIGYVNAVFSRPRTFEEEAVRLLTTALEQASTVIESLHRLNELTTSEAQLSEALKISKLGYWEYDVEKDLFLFNDQFYLIFHTTAEREGGYQLSSAQYAGKFVHPDDLPVVGSEIERALNSTDRHYSRQLEHRIQYADGGVGYISVSINIDRDEQGHILRYYGANQDITERQQAEEAVRRSEAQLSEALKIAKLAYWSYDVPTDTFTFNDQFYAVMRTTAAREGGYTMSSAQYAQRFVHPEDAPIVGREVQLSIETMDPNFSRELDHRVFYADGQLGYFTVRFRIEKDAQGRTIKTHGANQDITERKQAEQEFLRFKQGLEQASDAVFMTDLNGHITYANPAFENIYGYSREETLGQTPRILKSGQLSPDYYQGFWQTLLNKQSISGEKPNKTKDGRVIIVEDSNSPILDSSGTLLGFLSTHHDITARKLAEETLSRERNLLRILIDNLPLYVYIKDRNSKFVINNKLHLGVMGAASQEEVIGKGDFDFFPQEDAAQYYADEQALMQADQPLVNREETAVDQVTGQQLWVSSTKIPYHDGQGNVIGFVGVTQDITARKQTELRLQELLEKVQQSEQLMRTLIDAIPDHIYAKDLEGRLTLVNLAEARLHGVDTPEVLVGKSDFDLYPRELAEQYLASEQPILREGLPLLNHEEPNLDATGHSVWSSTTKVPLRNNQGQIIGLVGITRDVTDRKQAEAERERLIAEQQTRAVQLQTAAEIGRAATSLLDPNQLLSEIVELIAVRLGVYHVAVFTVDESGRWALIRAATGEVGQQLKDRGQALGIHGQSIVGNAIQRRQTRIALDVGAEAVQFNDPLLPTTRSQIALPLFVGDQVLGALDIQSTEPAAFDENSAILLQSMADQIAVALNNAEKYQREQAQVEQTNRLMQIVIDLSEPTDRAELQNRLVRSALSLLDTDRAQIWLKGASGLELKAAQSIRPGADQSLAISQELAERVCHTSQPLRLDSPPLQAGYASRITDVPFNAALLMPISWQSQTTGVLSVTRSQPGRPFTQDDENSAQLLAAQASAALENITLSEQQQHRTVQLQTAAEVSRAASSILKLDELLPQAVELIRARFNFYYVGIFLADEAGRWAVLRAGTGEAGQQMLANVHQLEIGGASMISQCIVKQQARIALDVGEEAIRFDNPLLPLTRSEMALPLVSRGRIIGAMTIQSDQPAAFTSEDITALQSMADQISNAVENTRLYEQTQTALDDTDQLLQASAELNVSQTYNDVLDVVRKYTVLGQDAQTIAVNVFDRPWTDGQTPVWIELIGYFTKRPSGMDLGTRFPIAMFPAAKALLRPDAPSVIEDLDTAKADPNTYALFVQRLASKSVIFIPLVVGGQWFGYMNVLYPNPTRFNEADVRRLTAMVGQAAVAVQNLRNLAAAQQTLTETDASYRATQAIGRAQSIEAILEATTHVVDLMGMTRAVLRVVTRRDITNTVTATDIYAYQRIDGQWVSQPIFKDVPVSDSAVLRPLQRNPEAVVIYADAQNPNSAMPDEMRQALLADTLRSTISTSVSLQNEVLGFLSFSGPQALNETAEQRLRLTIRTLSDQTAVALQNRLLYEQTRAALQEVDAINRRLTGEAWESYLHNQSGQQIISATDDSQTAPDLLPQLDGLLAAGEIVIEPAEEDQSEATVTAPILLRGQPIGALRMRTALASWNKDTEAVLTDIAGHIAQAVENARLIEQTQRTASRERAINEINARVRQTIDLDAILRTAVNELGQSLKAARVTARINVADNEQPSRRNADTGDQSSRRAADTGDQSSRRAADTGSQPGAAGNPRGNDHD